MNVDIAKTKAYYNSIIETSMCDCAYCRNYRLQVKSAFPKVAEYLYSLGIDIEKPLKPHHLNPMKIVCWNTVVASILHLELAIPNTITELTM